MSGGGILFLVIWLLIIVFGVLKSRPGKNKKQMTENRKEQQKQVMARRRHEKPAGRQPYEHTPVRRAPEKQSYVRPQGQRPDSQERKKTSPQRGHKEQQTAFYTGQLQENIQPGIVKDNLMQEVQDLMIMGPDTSTYFERDFIAEGIAMINRSLENV